ARRSVLDPPASKKARPHVLGRGEDLQREMLDRRVETALPGRRALLSGRRVPAATPRVQAAERGQDEIADDEHDHAADPEAARDQRQKAAETAAAEAAAAPGQVVEIGAFALVAEPHSRSLLSPLPNA